MKQICIIIPCFNEGESIGQLLNEIDDVLKEEKDQFTAVIVDDGSTIKIPELNSSYKKIALKIISLPYNIGHQGAIGQGLIFAAQNNASGAIIMDGDGEDDPAAIPLLLAKSEFDIVHVKRGKRTESFGFRFAYVFYKIAFRIITNKKMNFGNYCMISSKVISVFSVRSFIHFAAFLSKLKFNSTIISYDRRKRTSGKSKMGVTNLIHHAFRSFAEYGESLLMIFLRLFVILFVLFIITIGYIVYLKIFTEYPIIGWSSTIGMGLLTSALLCMGFFVSGVLFLNLSQNRANIPPVILYKEIK